MATATSRGEKELAQPPKDGISSVRFGPTTANHLLVSSWDRSVGLYDVPSNTRRAVFYHDAAVLDACFSDASHGLAGGLDGKVKWYDFNAPNGAVRVLGEHANAVRATNYCSELGVAVTGGWDNTVKLWDPRQPQALVLTMQQPERVYTMDVTGTRAVVGMASRHVWVWDLRNGQNPTQKRESSLKYQTRCLRCTPDGTGYTLSSIEGRVAVEFLDPSPEAQKKKYAFKCHRVKDAQGADVIYPVNAIAFHPKYGTFATGGSDGIVNIWDGANKKRLCQLHRYPCGVSSLSFNSEGDLLAIASSYAFEDGPKEHPADAIFIRNITDSESKPK